MKVFIMTDMEGVAGVLNHDDWVVPGALHYPKGVRLLTEEVNAAVRGFLRAGASEIVVSDGHGYGGIDPELLHPAALLKRGRAEKDTYWPWEQGLGDTAMAFVGQHAKAGTDFSHITHTQWFNYIDQTINGVSIGEYGESALCCMERGVPTILACGEEALCREAEALTPGVFTVAGKRGLLRDNLEHLDTDAYRKAKLGAIHRHPRVVRAEIETKAREALEAFCHNPSRFSYIEMKPPYRRVIRYRRNGDIPAFAGEDSHPDSLIELMDQPRPVYKP